MKFNDLYKRLTNESMDYYHKKSPKNFSDESYGNIIDFLSSKGFTVSTKKKHQIVFYANMYKDKFPTDEARFDPINWKDQTKFEITPFASKGYSKDSSDKKDGEEYDSYDDAPKTRRSLTVYALGKNRHFDSVSDMLSTFKKWFVKAPIPSRLKEDSDTTMVKDHTAGGELIRVPKTEVFNRKDQLEMLNKLSDDALKNLMKDALRGNENKSSMKTKSGFYLDQIDLAREILDKRK